MGKEKKSLKEKFDSWTQEPIGEYSEMNRIADMIRGDLEKKTKQAVKEAYEELCSELVERGLIHKNGCDRIPQIEIRRVFKDKFGFEL